MKISSPNFQNNTLIPARYTCDGENISPSLVFEEIPSNAKSLVLIVDDPDAPAGDWVHWLLWNILPQTKELAENFVPAGTLQGTNDFGETKWGGPCPPSGRHHYHFKLYALDILLELPITAKKAELEAAMNGHILAEAVLIGLYQRI